MNQDEIKNLFNLRKGFGEIKTIGLDVDELLRRFVDKTVEVYRREFPDHWVNPVTMYDLHPSFQIGRGIYNFFNVDHAREIYEDAEVFAGAVEFVDEIKSMGLKVLAITNQKRGNEAYTINFLDKHFGQLIDNILFLKEKEMVMVDMMVDDCTENLVRVSKNNHTIPIAISRSWNKDWQGYRCENFDELLRSIRWMQTFRKSLNPQGALQVFVPQFRIL